MLKPMTFMLTEDTRKRLASFIRSENKRRRKTGEPKVTRYGLAEKAIFDHLSSLEITSKIFKEKK